jgi:exonuclease VII small subunit
MLIKTEPLDVSHIGDVLTEGWNSLIDCTATLCLVEQEIMAARGDAGEDPAEFLADLDRAIDKLNDLEIALDDALASFTRLTGGEFQLLEAAE